ncbi:MAG: hypothetical protein JNM00_15035 [Flavobacteriales bacterium]|nr:hypothetical protein [Flavobacteriales bacterium]
MNRSTILLVASVMLFSSCLLYLNRITGRVFFNSPDNDQRFSMITLWPDSFLFMGQHGDSVFVDRGKFTRLSQNELAFHSLLTEFETFRAGRIVCQNTFSTGNDHDSCTIQVLNPYDENIDIGIYSSGQTKDSILTELGPGSIYSVKIPCPEKVRLISHALKSTYAIVPKDFNQFIFQFDPIRVNGPFVTGGILTRKTITLQLDHSPWTDALVLRED